MGMEMKEIILGCMVLIVLMLISCSTPNEVGVINSYKFYVDSLSLKITSEMHPDYQEMRGRAYLHLLYHFEGLPGRIEKLTIDPIGTIPISIISIVDKCSYGPIPVDTVAGGSSSYWFWDDLSGPDSITVDIILNGSYWDIIVIGDSCKVFTYGPMEWSTRMQVDVED